MSSAVDILFVEDSEADVALALRALERDGVRASASVVASEPALRAALAARVPGVVLSDFAMPGFDGLHALRIVRELAPDTPFIFVSGTIGEERAIEAIRGGATDYVLKDNLKRLATAVRRALREADERKAHLARIEHHANFDALTDLPNRRLLADRAAQAITHARRTSRPCALLVLDLDGFKLVNDGYGHGAGDALIRAVAGRLRAAVREGDTVARLGADAFCVLAADLARPDDAQRVAHKLREATRAPFSVDGREVHLTLSLGVSIFPRDGEDFDLLLRNADAAMHRVKDAGGDAVQHYDAAMTREVTDRIELGNALRSALQRRELEVHLQPQVALPGLGIVGMEALVRWRHPQRGPISPAQFIPIAEESDLIASLGEWVLAESCRLAQAWSAPARVAVNVSARQFRSPGFPDLVARTLRRVGLAPQRLELELTEGVLVDDEAIALLAGLKSLGVQIAVDDFGTGYSSLRYLSRLPADCLKIDRSFVTHAADGGRDASIAQAIISLAHSLGMRVLAEGVETAAQRDFLRAHGCDEAQGYLFARPGPAPGAAELLARGLQPAAKETT